MNPALEPGDNRTAPAPRKILVLSASGIGINLLCLPMLRHLRSRLPGVRIDVLVRFESGKQLLEVSRVADRVWVIPKDSDGLLSKLRFSWEARRQGYDTVISTLPGNRLDKNLLAWFTGAERRIAPRYRVRYWRNGNFLNTDLVPIDVSRHDVEHNLSLLQPLGLSRPDVPDAHLPSVSECRLNADRWLAERGLGERVLFGMHPGSSLEFGMEYKRWPAERFVEVARTLLGEHADCHWLVFRGPQEEALAKQVAASLGSRITAVDLPLGPVAELLRHCRLFLCNDNGVMHLAAAVGVPVVAVFGPTDYRRTRPWGANHQVVRAGIDCSPCFRVETLGEPFHCVRGGPECLKDVTVQQVTEACRCALARFSHHVPRRSA